MLRLQRFPRCTSVKVTGHAMKRTCEVSRDLRLVVDILDTDGWSCSNKICGVYPTQRTLDYDRNKTGLLTIPTLEYVCGINLREYIYVKTGDLTDPDTFASTTHDRLALLAPPTIGKGVRFVDLVSGPLLSELMNPARPLFLLPPLCTPTTQNPFTSNKSTDSSSINVICRNWTWEEK